MKKALLALTMVLAIGLMSNVAFTDEVWPYAFWQHGWDCFTFWSVTNFHPTGSITATVTLKDETGAFVASTAATVLAQASFQPATEGSAWYPYQGDDKLGYGTYSVDTPAETAEWDCVYVWACVYGHAAYQTTSFGSGIFQPGFTVVDPGNPHGVAGM